MDFPDLTLLGPMASYHFNRDAGYNERHPAVGFMSPEGWAAGYYKNSHNRPSFYVGREFQKRLSPNFSAGLMVGGVTGYPLAAVSPAVLPSLIADLPLKQKLALLLMPPVGKVADGGIALQYRKELK